MIEWLKNLLFGKDSDMKLDLKEPIKVPEKVLDKLWVRKIVVYSRQADGIPNAEIHCMPYCSADGSFSESDAKLIQIENVLENPDLSKVVQNLLNSLQDAVNSNGISDVAAVQS